MLSCPRDNHPLVISRRAEGKFEIDVCTKCHGAWIDVEELSALCPTISHLPDRRQELVYLAMIPGENPGPVASAARRSVITCPRCQGRVLEVLIAGATIDFCLGCGGAWLDGDEADELLREPAKEEREPSAGSPFRQSALELVRTGKARCGRCRTRLEPDSLVATKEAFLCKPCWVRGGEHVAEPGTRPEGRLIAGLGKLLGAVASALRTGPPDDR